MDVNFQQFNVSDLRYILINIIILIIFRLANGTYDSQWEAAV